MSQKALLVRIPQWGEGRAIYIFADRELIYKKEIGGPWERKVVRCDLCGECCRNVGPTWPWRDPETGDCRHLKYETVHHADGTSTQGYFCRAPGPTVPFTCCKGRGTPEECIISREGWEVVG